MKKIKKIGLLSAGVLFLIVGVCHAMDTTLSWDANSESNLGGYKVHYNSTQDGPPYNGTGATEGDSPIDVGNVTTYTIHGLPDDASERFVVTAYNDQGLESGYSNEVIGSLAPEPPNSLIISAVEKIIAALQDIKTILAQVQ